jgi:hypothetical protein
MLMENLYHGKNSKTLDPRSVAIIRSRDDIKIWVGALVPKANLDVYKRFAEDYIKILQQYERAPQLVSYVQQGNEDASFWRMFNSDKAPRDFE